MKDFKPPPAVSDPAARPFSPDDPLLPPEAASAYFGGAPTAKTLERYRQDGIGPRYLKLAGRILYRRSDLDAYLDRCVHETKTSRRGAGAG